MEIVVLNSDIARLVLDYLKSQNLKRATHIFCKTSPYLKQEFSAYKQGLQTHSFFPELEEIICEYVKISRKVEQLLPKLTNALSTQLQQSKLSEKVNELLDRALQAIISIHANSTKNDSKNSDTVPDVAQTTSIINDTESNNVKRKRSFETLNSTSNEETSCNMNTNRKHKSASSRLGHYFKKRRVLEPYCFLSSKALQRHKRRCCNKEFACTTDEDAVGEEHEEWSQSSFDEDENISEEVGDDNDDDCDGAEGDEEIFNRERPTKQSTPQNKSKRRGELLTPILPEISQAILDNPEFQQKLVENINQALSKSNTNNMTLKNLRSNTGENSIHLTRQEMGTEFSPSQILDQMVKNILDATEKDPSFDAVIQEVVEASNKPQVHSAAIQCNINTASSDLSSQPLYTATEPPPLVPTQPAITQFQIQSFPPAPSTAMARDMIDLPSTSAPPRTPMIIRSSVNASMNTSALLGNSASAQDPPSMLASNNSFGSLIDPNFSISKLIVLNSNESSQKQHPETIIGNTTADNLMNQLPTSGVVDSNDEQVYFDTTTGQLTFPIFLTNDGLLTNFPFLINNEIVNQQLQSNNMGNLDTARIEIPLAEPIMLSANQLPQNSVIFSSNQKANVAENVENLDTIEKPIKDSNAAPPASLDNRLLCDRVTPSSSGIINSKAYKSLSTPRKRASHVRTLTFSPRAPQSLANMGTPLTTRREAIACFQKSLPKTIAEEGKNKAEENLCAEEVKENKTSEKVIIKTVEILPTIANAVNVSNESLKDNSNVSSNETTNIPHLFVAEESSNQTVINKKVINSRDCLKEPLQTNPLTDLSKGRLVAEAQQMENTPKRKQLRKSAVRACKRQLSKSSNEDDLLDDKPEKENKKTTDTLQKPDEKPTEDDMMEEWKRLRNSSNMDLDIRLRELNAKMTQLKPIKKLNTKKRVRRRKSAAIKKKEKELAKEAEELERFKELANNSQELKNTSEQAEKSMPLSEKHDAQQSVDQINDQRKSEEKQESKDNAIKCDGINENEKQKLKSREKPKEFTIKILTPQKASSNSDKTSKKDKKPREKVKKAADENVEKQEENLPPHKNEALEREKRTTNIAFLLETPFKDTNLSSCIPPTPGIFAPSLETPAGKQKYLHDEMQASASFLFGSVTKSELDTPLLSAITPGVRFTPFGLKDIGTPKSVTGTEYSSGGGSYYKPDESEDLDRNIDKMLRNSAQKKSDAEEINDTDNVEEHERKATEEGEIVAEQDEKDGTDQNSNEIEKIEVEIPVEKLRVEPIVLKRVKSFGSEAVDSMETSKINPHYTLASGLPEISAAEEECSSSSSSSESSSSSNSSSSSSSSTSSSSSSSKSSVKSKTVVETQSPKKINLNELENLSDISSTEDEEWQKLAVTDNDENSQLVSNDGEVRYPVRSWLTPVKDNINIETKTTAQTQVVQNTTSAKQATIKVTLPLKSAEKRNKQVKELELKRERIKEKLKNDASTITKRDKTITSTAVAPNISAALAASRMIHAMRDKGKKPACFDTQQLTVKTSTLGEEKRSIDVLTALNLSAKKHLPKTPENSIKTQPVHADDNANTISQENFKETTAINISSSSVTKTPQRKCLPIEARPVTRTIRKSGKKIVRTPLAFKVIHSPGKINSHSTTTTLAEFAATKTVNKTKDFASPAAQQTVRVSPSLMKATKLRGKKPPESPMQKTKSSIRNIKAKAAAIKPKIGRTRSSKKKDTQQPLLEKEMKELLDDWKEESLENENDDEVEDNVEQKPAIAIKPKIHLKARNAMISTKPKRKAIKKEELPITSNEIKNTESKVLSPEIQNTQPEVVVKATPPEETEATPKASAPTQPPIITTQSVSMPSQNLSPAIENVEDSSEDDPLEECEITTIDESDIKRFIKCTYNGPDQPPSVTQQTHDFSNFQMVVAIDENERYIWRITEGICLFSCAPNLSTPAITKQTTIRNIPKKRKVRATTVISDKTLPSTTTTTTSTSSTKISALQSFTVNTPTATSTPVTVQPATNEPNLESNGTTNVISEEAGSKSKIIKGTQPVETCKKTTPDTNVENPKIQIEDIETILSHLHGT